MCEDGRLNLSVVPLILPVKEPSVNVATLLSADTIAESFIVGVTDKSPFSCLQMF